MMLSELLVPAAVSVRLRSTSKREAIAELVELLETGHEVRSQGEILDRVLRREAMMSTGIGNGVAIPHGKARSVDRMLAACAMAPEGIDFEAVDGEPARLFILLVSPENVGAVHVRVLANISRLLKEESVRRQIVESSSTAELLDSLRAAEAKYLTPAS
jgi:PTS system nitrogen regulatory IIA component